MCDPISIFTGIGTAMSAVGAYSQGQAQASAAEQQAQQYRMQAELQNRQANIEQQTAQFKENQKTQQLGALRGQQVNAVGASGFALDGSPSDVIVDSQQKGQLDLAAIQYGADVKTQNLRFGQQVSTYNAQQSEDAADSYRLKGDIGAITPLIGLGANDKFMTRLGGMF